MVRIKERYLLVNIIYPPDPGAARKTNVPHFVAQHQPTVERLTPAILSKAIRAEVATLFGDYGAGALEGHLSIKYLSLATSTFIIRCARAHYQMLWAGLSLMDHVPVRDGRPCIFRVVRVSGTMRKAEEEAIRQARALVLAAQKESSPLAATVTAPAQALPDRPMLDSTEDISDDAMDSDDG